MNLPRTLCLLKCELGELWSSQCAGFLQVSVMLGHTLEEFLIDVRCQFVDCDFGSTKVQNMSANILWDVCFGLSEYDCPGCVRAERGMVSYIPAENAGVVVPITKRWGAAISVAPVSKRGGAKLFIQAST